LSASPKRVAAESHLHAPKMGRKKCKITAKDIAKHGSLADFIRHLVKTIGDGSASETQEEAVTALRSLAQQSHFEHSEAIFAADAVGPLIAIIGSAGCSANAQAAAAGALAAIGHEKPAHQEAIVAHGAIGPLVRLLGAGGAKAQEEAGAALAALSADNLVESQRDMMRAGAVPFLVAMLNGGSAAAQAFASQALANAARCTSADGQGIVAKAGAIPPLLRLLTDGKAQTPAAGCLSMLARDNKPIQAQIASTGGIPPLLALLNGRNTEAQVQAAAALLRDGARQPGDAGRHRQGRRHRPSSRAALIAIDGRAGARHGGARTAGATQPEQPGRDREAGWHPCPRA